MPEQKLTLVKTAYRRRIETGAFSETHYVIFYAIRVRTRFTKND